MSKLYFKHSAMDSGKSLDLIRTAYNYKLKGQHYIAFNAAIDTRFGEGVVASRAGVSIPSISFDQHTSMWDAIHEEDFLNKLDIVLVDEAQFLTERQVLELCEVVDKSSIPVLCYGLRADRYGKLFPGSSALFAHADAFHEIRSVCKCGRKATHNKCNIEAEGQVLVGDEIYQSVCRQCFYEGKVYA